MPSVPCTTCAPWKRPAEDIYSLLLVVLGGHLQDPHWKWKPRNKVEDQLQGQQRKAMIQG